MMRGERFVWHCPECGRRQFMSSMSDLIRRALVSGGSTAGACSLSCEFSWRLKHSLHEKGPAGEGDPNPRKEGAG